MTNFKTSRQERIQEQQLHGVAQVKDLELTCEPMCYFISFTDKLLSVVYKIYGFIVSYTRNFVQVSVPL